jgi:hypothetical protein
MLQVTRKLCVSGLSDVEDQVGPGVPAAQVEEQVSIRQPQR